MPGFVGITVPRLLVIRPMAVMALMSPGVNKLMPSISVAGPLPLVVLVPGDILLLILDWSC